MAKTSPTVRSLALLREQGYSAQVVERWNPYGRVRVDLFGFIDIVAIKAGENGVIGLQTTTQAHSAERIKKILNIPEAKLWLKAGNRILVHGWVKRSRRVGGKLWHSTEQEITLKDF